MNQILIFVSFVLVFALVQAVHNYPERRGCRVVQPDATSCNRTVAGINCRDRYNLVNHLANGTTQVMVCQSFTSPEPAPTDILVTLGMQWGADCRTYLGVTSICFMPNATDTRTCSALAADTRLNRVSCIDQANLRRRVVSSPTARICLLNPNVQPNVFVSTQVNLFATLSCINGINVSGELCN